MKTKAKSPYYRAETAEFSIQKRYCMEAEQRHNFKLFAIVEFHIVQPS